MFIERVEVDNRLPWRQKESDGVQANTSRSIINPAQSDTESPSPNIGSKITETYCVQRMELSNMLRMSQKESDIFHQNIDGGSNGSGAEKTVSKKGSKLSRIGSIISQKGSAISQKMSKISHRGPKITDPDDIQSEFSVFLDTKVPDAKLKVSPFNEQVDKIAKNAGLCIFDEYDEAKSGQASDIKILK